MSPMSKLFKVLTKLGFIPLKVDYINNEVKFSLISRPFILFILTIFGFVVMSTVAIIFILGSRWQELMEEMMSTMMTNVTDTLCYVTYIIIIMSFPIFPVMVARSAEVLPTEVTLATDLRWPKFGNILIIVIIIQVVACCFQNIVQNGVILSSLSMSTSDIVLFILMQSLGFPIFIIYNSSHLMVMVWLEKMGSVCSDTAENIAIESAKKCVQLHKMFDKGLGAYFLLLFSYNQVLIIVNLFNIISFQILNQYTFWHNILMSVSFFLLCVYGSTIILIITLTAEESFNKLLALKQHLILLKGM